MRWITSKAPVEQSLRTLNRLLKEGYDTVIWMTNIGACNDCRRNNRKKFDLHTIIRETKYNAPIYSKTHPGCKCRLLVKGDDLDDVIVDYLGIIP